MRSRFFARTLLHQPITGIRDLERLEVTNLGSRKWLAERRHRFMPTLLTDDCKTFDVPGMPKVELHIFPQSIECPAVEIAEFE